MSVHIDENLVQGDDGVVSCRHCDAALGVAQQPLRDACVRESDPRTAGPSVRAGSAHFADRPVVLRQTFCPGCLTLLQSEIVPGDEPSGRTRSVVAR
ncbi:hypothetical protein [Klenkia sp. PcliD-1-E]|uniref:hypothetical protein n=1 Tax=Klenkia sp. PcliD-1-E TaxID=2954492 RepID=UPI0020975284|nr:hypothetical protein [Klenkia sp. PcliD-1-E]MCO7218647.1 hypothetical protein [Klenkia sp. PcliD-1-E]